MSGVLGARSLTARLLVAQMAIALLVGLGTIVAFYFDASARLDQQLRLFATSLGASVATLFEADTDAANAFASEISRYHAQVIRNTFNMDVPPVLIFQGFNAQGAMRLRSEQAPAAPIIAATGLMSADADPPHDGSVFVSIDFAGRIQSGRGMPDEAGVEAITIWTAQDSVATSQSGYVFSLPAPPGGFAGAPPLSASPALRTEGSPFSAAIPMPVASTWNDIAAAELYDIDIDGNPWRAARVRDELGREIQVAQIAPWRHQAMLAALRAPLFHLLWIFPAALLLTMIVARYTLKPLRRLASAIGARSPNDLSALRPAENHVEMRPLVDEINRLLGQLHRLLASERDAFADAAHELLTPIAAIQAQAHLLRVAADDSTRGHAAAELDGGLARVSTLIRQLLMLARAGAVASGAVLVEDDLTPALQARVALAATRAVAKNIDVSLHAPATCRLRFEHDTLMAAVDNLLDNAIRYSPTGAKVQVILRCDRGVELIVSDNGPGIPLPHRRRAVDRFFRVPGTTEPGSGLGLSIVQCVAQLHGGTLTLEPSADGVGLTASLRFP